MATAEPSQFSLTVWPGGIVEPASMWHPCPEARLIGQGWVNPGVELDVPRLEPPAEMYLRLARDADLSDPAALLQVVREVGGVPPSGYTGDFQSETGYEAGWRRLAALRGLPYPHDERPRFALFHIAEVAWRLRVLDVCGRVAVHYLSGDHVWPIWAEQLRDGGEESPRREFMKMGKPQRERRVWQDWLGFMTPALRRWHVRPVISGLTGGPLWEESPPTLLEVGALQIMNDLARVAEYHVCANETCERLFARQVGDSEVFSRRTGVRFCSPSCRNAQQQREHRRRAKARKEGRSS